MELLYFFESIRFPLLDQLMLLLTEFGGEVVFLAAAIIVYWCVDKNRGYYIMSVGLVGTVASQFMKLLCKIPRPWVRDPGFTAVEGAVGSAGGYSFPSGHSQSAVGTFGSMACGEKNKALRWVFIAIAALVPVTRMYLGVHTPEDVLVGSAISLVLIFALRYVREGKYILQTFLGLTALTGVYLLVVQFVLKADPADVGNNYAHGLENAYTLFGTMTGMLCAYLVDRKWVNFKVDAIWWAQILKIVGGLAVVLAIKAGLKTPLNALFGEMPGRFVRYFLMVFVAGVVWPMTFRWFGRLGKKET